MRAFVGEMENMFDGESWVIKLQLVLQLIGCDRRWHDFVLPITGGTVVKVKHSCSNFHLEWKMTQAARLSIYGNLEVIEESRIWALLTSHNNNSLLIIIIIIIQMIIFSIIIICIFIIVIIKFSNFPQWKRRERKNQRLTVMVCFTEGPISKAFLTSETLSLYTTWSGLENLKRKKRNVSLLPTFGRRSVVKYFTFYEVPMVNS